MLEFLQSCLNYCQTQLITAVNHVTIGNENPVSHYFACCRVVSCVTYCPSPCPGCRATVWPPADRRKLCALTHLNKPCLMSHVSAKKPSICLHVCFIGSHLSRSHVAWGGRFGGGGGGALAGMRDCISSVALCKCHVTAASSC